jgi:hypothetical protein
MFESAWWVEDEQERGVLGRSEGPAEHVESVPPVRRCGTTPHRGPFALN